MANPVGYSGLSDEVIRQQKWSEAELREMGYEYFERIKEVTMVRQLPADEAPLEIETSWGDTLVAMAGYMVCYKPGQFVLSRLDAYQHWPVEPDIFQKTYKAWDVAGWTPSETEAHLIRLGCQPYYKASGVWAKRIDEGKSAYLQSLEHTEPIRVEGGRYVVIGAEGEPYSMGVNTLHSRYKPSVHKNILQRLLSRLVGA